VLIKIYTEDMKVHSFNIESTSITEDKIILEGIKSQVIMTKKQLIFEDSNGIPNMNIKNIQINGVNYNSENFENLKKLLI